MVEDLVKYVKQTPCNTNPAMVKNFASIIEEKVLPPITDDDIGKVLTVGENKEKIWAEDKALPDASGLENGTALIAVDGEWVMQEGYAYKKEELTPILEDTITTVKEYEEFPANYVFDEDPYADLNVGDKVKVTFNGTEYVTEVRVLDPEMGDTFIVFGGGFDLSTMTYDFSEFPFVCERSEGSAISTEEPGEYDVKIEKIEGELVPFSDEFISDDAKVPTSTIEDSGKVLTVNEDGKTAWKEPQGGRVFYQSTEPEDSRDGDIWIHKSINYLTFTAEEPNASLEMAGLPGAPEMDLKYSFNKVDWNIFEIGGLDPDTYEVITHGTVINLDNIGDKVYFKGNNDHGFCIYDEEEGDSYPNEFIIREKEISVSGNIMTIMDETGENNTLYENNFDKLFIDCYGLVNAVELKLPALDLVPYCYSSMFYNCTNLATAPELPAMTLAESCYDGMFFTCSSLVNAPELPATTLAESCYSIMFYNCSSLVNAPELPATTLVYSCYENMFNGCASLITAPELPATTLAEQCYNYMFCRCTSLINPPELPATTLSLAAYSNMFNGCSSLVNAPELPATILAESCYLNMFSGCSSLVNAPELPATTLASWCYGEMFRYCVKIKLSTTQTGEYQTAYRIPSVGTGTTVLWALEDMFDNTGGTFKGTPTINTTYYGAW